MLGPRVHSAAKYTLLRAMQPASEREASWRRGRGFETQTHEHGPALSPSSPSVPAVTVATQASKLYAIECATLEYDSEAYELFEKSYLLIHVSLFIRPR
jgi:hypothetical protein